VSDGVVYVIGVYDENGGILPQCVGCRYFVEETPSSVAGCLLHSGHGVAVPCPDREVVDGG